jgi:DNA primase
MEQLLGQPASLLDTIWDFEREAQPLNTPEDKAGLKARLIAHCDQIEDQDIRALYRRELLERFSDFAFPKREFVPRGGPSNFKHGGKPWQRDVPQRLTSETLNRLKRAISGGARDRLTQAVFAGLIQHYDQITAHTEALGKLAQYDPNATEMVETLFEYAETLDSHGKDAISGLQGFPAPPDLDRYAFLREGTDPVDAREELAEAVSLLVEKPALRAALDAAGARFDADPEGAFAEQSRLREQLARLDERLKQFGRRKASAGTATRKDAEDDKSQAGNDLAGELENGLN